MHSVFVADSRFSPEAVLKYPNMSLINKIDRWYSQLPPPDIRMDFSLKQCHGLQIFYLSVRYCKGLL